MAEIIENLSHDSINRYLLRENYQPKDLFEEIKEHIDLKDGTLSGDDTVIDKPYSDPKLTELIGYYWSGKHHRVVKGIQLITLYYTDVKGRAVPVNYRIYNKQEEKTKNEYFREMVMEVLVWGLKPKYVTADTWYASRENLKFLADKDLSFLMGIAKNRKVSLNGQKYTQIHNLEIPESGLIVHLKNFGKVKVFCRDFKNEVQRYYIMFNGHEDALEEITTTQFKELHTIHWGIECYHRALKQVCGIGRFMVRKTEAIKTHFFSAIRAFTQLELMRAQELIENWYEVQRNLSVQVVRDFILEHLKQRVGLYAYS